MSTIPLNSTTRRNFEDDLKVIDNAINALALHFTIPATNDDDRITQSGIAMNQLSNGYTVLLLARAKSLADRGKLDEAVADALKAIECQPVSVEGYLAVGGLYFTQGKLQAAIDIYEQGLKAVLPSEWPLLYEEREVVSKQMTRKVDFVTRLPVEITSNILTRLVDDPTLNSCVFVSKAWRKYLLHQCPELWRDICMSEHRDAVTTVVSLPSWAGSNHVQSLTLKYPSGHILEKIIELAKEKRFLSLKTLELDAGFLSSVEQHLQLMTLLASSLTKLVILTYVLNRNRNIIRDSGVIEVDRIMSLCPRLQYLQLDTENDILYRPQHSPPPLLHDLIIDAPNAGEQLADFIPLLSQLRQLVANSVIPGTLGLISLCCPRLKILAIGDVLKHHGDTGNFSDYGSKDKPGLHRLEYRPMDSNVVQKDVMPLFTRSQNTLKTLLFVIYRMDAIGTKQLAQMEFSQLSVLELQVDQRQLQDIASMIHRCEMLEDVCLDFRYAPVSDQFFTCLTHKPLLHTLQLSSFTSLAAAPSQLFAHYASRHQGCNLRVIDIVACQNITDTVLSTLADLTTLHDIRLRCLQLENLTADDLLAFVRKLHTLPYLKKIELFSIPQITDSMAAELANIDGLQILYLIGLNGVTSAGVQRVHESQACTLKQLRTLWYGRSNG